MKLFLMDLSWAPPQSFLTTQSSWALRTYLGVLQHRSVRLWRKEANSGTSSAAPLSTVPTPGLWVQHTLPHRACLAAATRRATHCTPRCTTHRTTHCSNPLRIERNSRKPCGLLLGGGGQPSPPNFPAQPCPRLPGPAQPPTLAAEKHRLRRWLPARLSCAGTLGQRPGTRRWRYVPYAQRKRAALLRQCLRSNGDSRNHQK